MSILAPLATALVALLLPAQPVAPARGAVWPLDPRPEVVTGFDPPTSPWGSGHRGVDLLGAPGQAVRAAAAGTVVFAGRIAGRGVVVVDHGATRTTYEPVEPTAEVGDRVRAGAAVGRLALAGSHCFPRACLHWGLIAGASTYLDPLSLVGAGPVRLLPLIAAPVPLLRLTAGPVLRLPLAAGLVPAAALAAAAPSAPPAGGPSRADPGRGGSAPRWRTTGPAAGPGP